MQEITAKATLSFEGRCHGEQTFRLNLQTPQAGLYMVVVFPNYSIGGGYISLMELNVSRF